MNTTVKIEMSARDYETVVASYTSPSVRGAAGLISIDSPQPSPAPKPLVTLPGGSYAHLLAALPLALLLGFIAWAVCARGGNGRLINRIDPYTQQARTAVTTGEKVSRGSLLAPLYAVTESIMGKSSLFRKFRADLERANLPLREVELMYMIIAAGAGTMAVTGLLMSLILILALTPVGAALPWLWVKFKARKRLKKFEDQLPDVLSTIAASLKAGHSFNQSINAVVKESPNPTAEELQRVLNEARLGLPMEDALQAMADRMGSSNFEFAVTTVNIQRTVGGSLSEILDMVAETVRGRQQFAKKVKALTGMGRMSAYVLLGMPIFIGIAMFAMSREYMEPLIFTPVGHKMLVATAVFMLIGGAVCQKIVSFKP